MTRVSMFRVPIARKAAWLWALALCAPLLLAPPLRAADGATITYRRVFKESVPEFIEIKVGEDGPASYDIRQLAEPADPEALAVGQVVRDKIFQLAGRLHNFQGADLDVHRQMANLGQKTFRYEKGTAVYEAQFNYTLNNDAAQLMTLFEGIALQQRDLDSLNQKLKYDRLGVNDALSVFEDNLTHRLLPEPERLLPVLDRVAADSRVVEIARERARSLAQRIRYSQPN